MRFYNRQHRHYCGIDLHVKTMYRCILNAAGHVVVVYEAGPCGFGIHRYLTAHGEDCVVVSPSSMPKRSGDRIKTDRRDGEALARLHRASLEGVFPAAGTPGLYDRSQVRRRACAQVRPHVRQTRRPPRAGCRAG